jgi:hypothetical protein
MIKKLITTTALVVTFAANAAAAGAAPPANVPPAFSPGACNMLHVGSSAVGLAGMLNSASGTGTGLANMMTVVIASETAGCPL